MNQELDIQNLSDGVSITPGESLQEKAEASGGKEASGYMKKRRDSGIKVRIKFRKYGTMRFIGHLDVMRFFQKLIRRAGIDIIYSEGFHPHQIMSFANPLGVGLISNGEYADITLSSVTSSRDIKDRLNAVSVEGLEITDVRRLPEDAGNAMASVSFADYSIRLLDKALCGAVPGRTLGDIVSSFFDRESIPIEKKTKKGSRVIDLKKSVRHLAVANEEEQVIFMKVNAGSAENIRPELVLSAIYDYAGAAFADFSYVITREEIYDENGTPLIDVGEVF